MCATLQACLGEQTAEGEELASTAWAVAAKPRLASACVQALVTNPQRGSRSCQLAAKRGPHGWQFHASCTYFRDRMLVPRLPDSWV